MMQQAIPMMRLCYLNLERFASAHACNFISLLLGSIAFIAVGFCFCS